MSATASMGIAAVTVSALKPVIDHLYQASKDKVKEHLGRWRIDQNIEKLKSRVNHIRRVKTFWQIDREVDLHEFYYPTRVRRGADKPLTIRLLSELTPRQVIIEGIAGQGKSIFLRFLASRCIVTDGILPIFVDLKEISKDESLASIIQAELRACGFDPDGQALAYLYDSGKLCVFLDGFDEIPEAHVLRAAKDIERLARAHPSTLRIIVSTRPGTVAKTLPLFETYRVCELSRADLKPLLGRLMPDSNSLANLYDGLKEEDRQDILGTITTPLMATLLVFHFKTTNTIPENLRSFYENLFPTLLIRHDQSKPAGGVDRKRQSKLSDTQLEAAFNALSFVCINHDQVELSRKLALRYASEGLASILISTDAGQFLDDIRSITCLLLEEGQHFRFIHKSVPEFHAAQYIHSLTESTAERFYQEVIRKEIPHRWAQTLNFLELIDTHRFLKFFLIGQLEPIFNDLIRRVPKDISSVSKAQIGRLYAGMRIKVASKGHGTIINGIRYERSAPLALIDYRYSDHLTKLLMSMAAMPVADGKALSIADICDTSDEMCERVKSCCFTLIRAMEADLSTAKALVHAREKKERTIVVL